MNGHKSVKTIANPEFINLTPLDVNPLMSKCQIKVFYLGENRNHSYIDKETALKMSKTLRGCPIVGAYLENKEDFGDHGNVITIEDGEVHFSCKTVPYGFVAPDAEIWFQTFVDIDDFGEEVEREYLVTTGYLWTDQYPESQQVIEEGKGQSMELDNKNLEGHWATNSKSGMDFFIINDAVFSKLCILGDNVEPCFEGASITDIENHFSKDSEFTAKLFAMIQELNQTLYCKGGVAMIKKQDDQIIEETSSTDNEVEQIQEEEVQFTKKELDKEEFVEETDNDSVKEENKEYQLDEAQVEEESESIDYQLNENDNVDDDNAEQEVEEQYSSISNEKLSAIEAELNELRAFKLSIENQQKDALIAKYHMLTNEDKADIIAKKEEYSLEQIEEKLALIYVRKNVDFSTVDGIPEKEQEVEEDSPLMSFSLDNINAEDAEDPVLSVLRLVKR